MNFFALAWKNVLRNRRRSLITIFIAALGCASVLIAGGFALYTYETLSDGSAREYGHLTVAHRDFFERDEETPMQFGINNSPYLSEKLRQDPRVRHILPRVSFSGLISNGDKSVIFLGTGADLNSEAEVRGPYLRTLEGSVKIPEPGGVPYVLLGTDLARSLGAHPGTGLTLMATTVEGSINAIDVIVSGIVATGWSEVDKRLVYVDVKSAQRLLATDKVSTLSVYLSDLDQVAAVQKKMAAADPGLTFQPWWKQAFFYRSVKELYNRIFGLLGIIITALVLFSVVNTLAMTVVERTREIGTLRALGAYPREVVAQFVREGMLIGIAGVVAGNFLAGLATVSLPYLGLEMPPPPGRSVGYPLLISASVLIYVVTDIVIVFLCGTAAWFVSRNAAHKPIVEALGHV